MSVSQIVISLFVISIFSIHLSAQNKPDYFRVFPVNDINMPLWAEMMYAADPNVNDVINEYEIYLNKNGFEKNIHSQNFKHWIRQIESFVNEQGNIRQESDKERKSRIAKIKFGKKDLQKNIPSWTALGPFETYIQGTKEPYSLQANIYAIDILESDPQIMICGTETGSVYYSSDKGLSWVPISDHAEFEGGVTAVKIHPNMPDRFLICTDERIYETNDRGTTWTEIHDLNSSGNEITFDPQNSDHIFCTTSGGLFESLDGGINWTRRFQHACYDIDYHPNNNSIIFLLKENSFDNRCELYKSVDNGITWTLKDNGWYIPEDPVNAVINGGKIAVTRADPSRVYACLIGDSKAGDNGWIGVYRSDDSGENWYLPAGQIGGPYQNTNSTHWNLAAYDSGYHQGFYNFDLEANQEDPDIIWIGTIRLSESRDGGKSFKSIGAANSIRLDNQHADIQDIEVLGNEVWVASDGGINYSPNYLNSSFSRKQGINGSEFWGFGSGWNEDLLVGGKYHNGNAVFYQGYDHGIFHNVGGVEESTGYVHPMDSRKAYFNKYWADGTETVIIPENLGDPARYLGILPYIPNESYLESWSSGFFFDPRYANHIFMGESSMLWKSTNGGNHFERLHDFGIDKRVLEIKVNRSDPDVIYTVVGGPGYWDMSEIQKSVDGGKSWSGLSNLPVSMWRLEIDINPEDPNEIWTTTLSGGDGFKVFRSLNGGSTWENMTSPVLDGHSPRDIFFQAGTDGVIYVASRHTVFKYDPNDKIWYNLNEGIPFILKGFEMRPFYKEMKLRIATYGKGIWEIPLEDYSRPIAQAMTHEKDVYCSRDTIQFDCYSVLDHEDASWSWDFQPAPIFITDPASRNPRVVFGNDGNYDVALTIEDKNGNQSNYVQKEMITIHNLCEMDSIPGMAVSCLNSGDFVQTNDFNKQVSEFTMTAWIKTDSIQNEWAGIVINDEIAAGLNFKTNNELGYHWPGGQWWWDSDLVVPENEWTHVAMVVRSGSVSLYVNGKPSVHNINVDPLNISSFKIGSYQGWSERNFKGLIDEVALWERALTTEDIRKYRHLTKEDFVDDPEFMAYYQFNAPISKALDRKSNYHANLAGGSEKVISNGPFGQGSSSSATIDHAGDYNFPEQGVMLSFDEGSLPDGEVWLSRIESLPNIIPNEKPGPNAYWILNNYGLSQIFEAAESISFSHEDFKPTYAEMETPELIELFSRRVNSDIDDWYSICNAVNVSEKSFEFDRSCQLRIESQFYLSSENTRTSISNKIPESIKKPVLFPNPCSISETVKVYNPLNESFDLYIYDQSGKIIYSGTIKGNTIKILDKVQFNKGLYAFKFQNKRLLIPGTIVIQ